MGASAAGEQRARVWGSRTLVTLHLSSPRGLRSPSPTECQDQAALLPSTPHPAAVRAGDSLQHTSCSPGLPWWLGRAQIDYFILIIFIWFFGWQHSVLFKLLRSLEYLQTLSGAWMHYWGPIPVGENSDLTSFLLLYWPLLKKNPHFQSLLVEPSWNDGNICWC